MAEGLARAGWDLDLRFGKEREVTLAQVLDIRGGHHLELKSDQKARVTGHVFIEFRQYGKKSGIATTESNWWTVEVDENVFVTCATDRMRALARSAYKDPKLRRRGGDDNAYEGVLVPIEWLVRPWRSA